MKTKNLFWSMLVMSGMLFATSCSQDELENVTSSEDFVQATFTIGTADGIGSRAVGDGTTVDKVACAVYDANGNELKNLGATVNVDNKKATFETRLAKGQSYRIAFFAYNAEANAYNVENLKNITVNTDQLSNVEGRDAFTAYHDVEAGLSAINENVTLKRPFAQLNLGVDETEWTAAVNAGVEVTKSYIKVSNVKNAFSAYDNAVAANAQDVEMVFALNNIPEQKLEVDLNKDDQITDDEKFRYLALNYLLVGNKNEEKSLTNVVFNWEAKGGKTNSTEIPFLNIPVQRNYRTNIIGKLLTSPANFNIFIDATFTDDNNKINPDYIVEKVFNAADLQAAIDAAPAGQTTTIYLGNDIKGNVTILQKEGVDLVIDGTNYKWDGAATINGNARANGAETLTFKNINFVASEAKTFIGAPTKINDKYNYSHNVTVDNCTFSSEAYNDEIVGIKLLTTYNAVVKNCTATNIHTLAQFQSTDNATVIENVKVVSCKNGISLGNMASATINGAEISAKGYGVRLDGEKTREVAVTIKDATIKAYIPVNVRKMNNDACKATVKLEGTNDLQGYSYEIAFCSNEYEEGADPEAPKGTFTLDGADDFRAYPSAFVATTKGEFIEALNNSGIYKITLETDVPCENTEALSIENDLIVEGNGKTITAGGAASLTPSIATMGKYNVTLNNMNVVGGFVGAYYGANVTFNGNLKFTDGQSGRNLFYAAGTDANKSVITIKDGDFNMANASGNSYLCAHGNAVIYVEGGNFYGKPVGSSHPYVKEAAIGSYNGQVIITGGTFNFDPSEWVAEGYAATQSGSTWTVAAE